jgi:hypothetical protein
MQQEKGGEVQIVSIEMELTEVAELVLRTANETSLERLVKVRLLIAALQREEQEIVNNLAASQAYVNSLSRINAANRQMRDTLTYAALGRCKFSH